MITKSIRWRFVLWLAFLLLVVLSGFGFTAYQLHRNNRFDQLDAELESRVNALSAALRTPPRFGGRPGPPGDWWGRGEPPRFEEGGPGGRGVRMPPPEFGPPGEMLHEPGGRRPLPLREGPPDIGFILTNAASSAEITNLFEGPSTNDFYYALWSRGNATLSSTNAPAVVPQPERSGRDTGIYTRTRGTFREAYQYTERGDCVLTGRTVALELTATRRFAGWLGLGGLAVLMLGMCGAWMLAGRVLQPVHQISATATRISAGNLAERINLAETDNELGQLAAALNSTFARLEAAFDQQKQFTADASHELRTPLAVMISEAQTTLARSRTEVEYRETIGTFLDTAQQMRRLTESLLELARFDAGQENLQHERLDLADCARAAVELLHPLADARALTIHCELSPAPALGDAQRLGQVVTNLLTNAIHYNQAGGQVRIATGAAHGHVLLAVTDTGPGIAPDDLPHLFERFYRADKSRSHPVGRNGLGLAISKAIVDSHGGDIEVRSEVGKGATFTVRLPAA